MTDVSDRLSGLAPSEQTFVGYLFWLSRPRFWLYLAGPVVVGVAYGAPSTAAYFTPLSVALFSYFLVPANIFLYGINDIFDADIDEDNPKKSDEGKEVKYRGGRAVAALVVLSALAGLLFVPALPPVGIGALVAFLALGATYSAPPLRFKTTPLLDSVSNGLYITPGIVAFAALAGELPPVVAIAGGWCWTMGMHTFSAIPDIEPDRAAGIRTTATFLGKRWTFVYCLVCWLAAAAVFALVDLRIGLLLVAYPVVVFAVFRSEIDVERAYWWYPAFNTVVGTLLTLGALWRLLYA